MLTTRLAEIESRLGADSDARREAADRGRRIEETLRALANAVDTVNRHVESLDSRQSALNELRARQSTEIRDISVRLDAARKERTQRERELEEHRERNRRIDIEQGEVRVRLEASIESLRRDLEVEPDVAVNAPLPELPDGMTPILRIRDLERELRIMGPINPLALQEFESLQQRSTFLEEQLEDVKNSRRELVKVIKQVDLEIQQTFASAYADVRDNFAKLFAMLFPGGSGRLVLTSPDDLLNTGIEVEAKPGGKNVKKLSLLSGGERSLTALAFLFAVFRSRPSPFYVMDEVEAALDDVNLHRFLGLVDEFRKEAQLLIVSHQKRTMEAGDSLLGVTMQPGGSSKVVVERVAARSA
jgi:chromosome segregation protein